MARTRNRTGYGQWLLLVALLLGIVTMHTLGHPSGEHASHAAVRGGGHGAEVMGHGVGHAAVSAPDPAAVSALELKPQSRSQPQSPSRDGAAGMGMDPLSVCLAVLGAFTLVLLVRAGLSRPGGTLARAPAVERPSAPRPEAPPPRVLLSRLSVLRI
ncbi:hypothetical protein [Streptomyces sp. KN37]|uniref:hypothetical protein n=1 Tax=Streptomyces sp. KN37 TaxID=3090667 RepID=UPI002A75E7AA|nr:hypothetical protein [Streptomyces sp. KN37]WPO74184.1 hypothetical protein R9806_28010 [Streptomyces sp. KN37]